MDAVKRDEFLRNLVDKLNASFSGGDYESTINVSGVSYDVIISETKDKMVDIKSSQGGTGNPGGQPPGSKVGGG